METLIQVNMQGFDSLNRSLISRTKLVSPQPYKNTFNIFDNILNFYKKGLSDEQVSKFIYLSSCAEKALDEARGKRVKSAYVWIKTFEASSKSLPIELHHISNTLYYPALSFVKYASGDYEGAISDVSHSLITLRKINEDGLTLAMSAWFEQYLNTCRVLFASKDYDKAFSESANLIYFMVSGEYRMDESLVYLPGYKNLDKQETMSMIRYVTDAVIVKLCSLKEVDEMGKGFKIIFHNLIEYFYENNIENDYYYFLQAISSYFNGANDNFVEFFDKAINCSSNESSSYLKALSMKLMILHVECQNMKISNEVIENLNLYAASKLPLNGRSLDAFLVTNITPLIKAY